MDHRVITGDDSSVNIKTWREYRFARPTHTKAAVRTASENPSPEGQQQGVSHQRRKHETAYELLLPRSWLGSGFGQLC